jgi:dienelactone hydrolase
MKLHHMLSATSVFLILMVATAQAKVVTRTVPYEHEGVKLQGFLAYDDASASKRPAVLVVHEWWGLNDYARKRAEQLAALGYVAFALDMYGNGKSTMHPNEASQWMSQINENIDFWRKRALAGLQVLRQDPHTDTSKMAAIGYCFGGATVQQLAYAGADLKGIVSFHGSLQLPPADAAATTRAKILLCHGGADPFTKPEDLQKYLAAMEASRLDYQIIIFGGAKHSFTNPQADQAGMPALKYDPRADRRSWALMKLFFGEIFGG